MNKRIKKKHRKQKLMDALRKVEKLEPFDSVLITGLGVMFDLKNISFNVEPSILDKSELTLYATLENVKNFK